MIAATWVLDVVDPYLHGLPPADDATSCISAAIRSSRWAIIGILDQLTLS
jgi:hypothetical protein